MQGEEVLVYLLCQSFTFHFMFKVSYFPEDLYTGDSIVTLTRTSGNAIDLSSRGCMTPLFPKYFSS